MEETQQYNEYKSYISSAIAPFSFGHSHFAAYDSPAINQLFIADLKYLLLN